MSKSRLTKASYAHDLEAVRTLIAEGADVDGSDNEVWNGDAEGCLDGAPYYTPLGEACRSGNGSTYTQGAIVDALLAAGAEVDKRNYRNETAFHFACQGGRAAIIRKIAAAGADLTLVGCLGNGVNALVNSHAPDEPGGPKVDGLRAILELGVDPRIPGAWGDDLVEGAGDYTGNLTARSKRDKARGIAMLELMELVGEAVPDYPALDAWLEVHRAARLQGDAKLRKAHEKLVKLRSAASEPGFENKLVRAFGKDIAGRYDDLARLAKQVLMDPDVASQPDWPAWVRALLERTVDYGDLTENTYGVRLTLDQMDEDEGGALDFYADENLSTVEHCLVACRAEGAWERDDFADLVRTIAREKAERIGFISFGDDEAVALAAHLDRVGSPDAAELRSALRKAFPFGAWG